MNLKVLVTMAALFSTTAYAQGFKFDRTQFAGTGCKQGATSTTTSPDGKALSILFDDFAVEVPQMDGDNDNDFANELNRRGGWKNDRNLDHKRCAMTINADVPQGEVIDSIKIKLDMRGSAYIEEDARVVFQSFLRNWKGKSKKFNGHRRGKLIARKAWDESNFEDEWTVSKTITIPINTGCHARSRNKVQFTLNSALMASMGRSRHAEGMAFSTIDSHDFGGKLNFTVITKPCGSRLNGGRQTGRVRVSDNSRNPDDRNHGETRADRDARRRNNRGNNGRGNSRPRRRP